MSFEAEDTEYQGSIKDLLETLIARTNIMIRHLEELNGQVFTEEDLGE